MSLAIARRSIFVGTLMLAATCVSPIATLRGATPPDRPGWQTTWYDDFNGNSVNTDNWQVITSTNPT
ncbi:MAG: hypothetical protein AAGF97_14720, partial [Planctomycetota bacterium]